MRLKAGPLPWMINALLGVAACQVHAHDPGVAGLAAIDRPALGRGAPDGTPADSTRLYLEVVLNQTRLPQLMVFELRDARLHAPAGTLRSMGFRDLATEPDELVPLDAIPGLEVRYEVARQRVLIDAPLSMLALESTTLRADGPPPVQVARPSPGALLNYDLYASDTSYGRSIAATSELRLFGMGRGVFSNTAVSRRYTDRERGWRSDSVRLDTHWTLSLPGPAITATVGDTFTGFMDWTRTVRIGGIQVGRNYALQPYRITAPLPEFLGEAVVPSDVELYINGVRQYSGRAPVGPFQLTAPPGISGAGHAQLVVTDAFGRVRSLDFPFYSTQRLLARGLTDWSVSLGAVREDFGIRSFSYQSDAVASASWRRGMSDRFTLEAHAEGGANLWNAGLGGAWLLGIAGVMHASHARSGRGGDSGSQSSLGWTWNSQRFHVSLDSRRTHGAYHDIASLQGTPPSRRSERATAGMSGWPGNFSLSWVRLDHPAWHAIGPDAPDPDGTGVGWPQTSRYAGLYWNRSFAGRWSASLSINQNVDDSRDRSLHLGVAVPLGPDRQFSASWQRQRDRDHLVADLARPVPGDGGLGWRVQGRAGGGQEGGLAEIGWQGEQVRLGAGTSHFGDSRYSWAQATGSLVRMGGATFAARQVHDAFAVVSTDGWPGIPVQLENRVVGHTDDRGMLLVARLNAWQRNKLSIDPMELPADVRVEDVEQIVTPADRSGAHARFTVRPVRAAIVVLHDASGEPLPVGTRIRLADATGEGVVGYGGEAYLEDLGAHNRIRAEGEGRTCTAEFAWPADAGEQLPRIGPLRCNGAAP